MDLLIDRLDAVVRITPLTPTGSDFLIGRLASTMEPGAPIIVESDRIQEIIETAKRAGLTIEDTR